MSLQRFSVKKRIRSFVYAINGLKILIREEHNARIHVCVALCVVLAGFLLGLSSAEWIAVVVVIGMVFTLEILNSAIENLSDFISPGKHLWIKKIKDLSAAGVLVAAITAATVGVIVFLPKITALFCW